MRVSVLAIGASVATGAVAASSSKAPACVAKCWEYTKYVTLCGEDTQCLCDDAEYQNAVYQCLYSQCSTAYFANALHHTLAICNAGPKADAEAPALIRQEGLKVKRDQPLASNSNSVSASNSVPRGSPSRGSPGASGSATSRTYNTRASPVGSVSGSAYTRSYNTRASPNGSGSAYVPRTSSRASPAPTTPAEPTPASPGPSTYTGAAATAGNGYGMLAVAGGMALAALA